jgi:quercetin dioxygenase-like cupin family protein
MNPTSDTESAAGGPAVNAATAAGAMTHLEDLATLVAVAEEATVSRTVLKAEGVRLVLFSFDTGQELSEHTAAMPVLLQVLGGKLSVTAAGRTVQIGPGGLIHFTARLPHSVLALEPTQLLLTMLDPRAAA